MIPRTDLPQILNDILFRTKGIDFSLVKKFVDFNGDFLGFQTKLGSESILFYKVKTRDYIA